MSNEPQYDGASVKVMRSYDYCHFEVQLSFKEEPGAVVPLSAVDAMRKDAARLADKAGGMMKCPACGNPFDPEKEGGLVSANPYAMPVCGKCLEHKIARTQ